MMESNRKPRAVLYCRVAHEDQAALDTQENLLRAYAREKGYEVIGTIKEACAGLSMERPGLRDIAGLAELRLMDTVLATKGSRFGRSTFGTLSLAEQLGKDGVSLETADEGPLGPQLKMTKALAEEFSRR